MSIETKSGFLRKYINNNKANLKDKILYKGNPDIQFFKKVYHKYYHFTKESHTYSFNKTLNYNILDFDEEKKLSCILDTRGDLLSTVFLNIELPKIVTDSEHSIYYINNLGLGIIKNIQLKIKGNIISSLDGKKIYILNQLLEKKNNLQFINKDSTIPTTNINYSKDNTNKLYNNPLDFNKEKITIPIPFGFFKHSCLNIPLFLFNTQEVEVELILRPLKELYTIEAIDKDYWYYAKNDTHYNISDTSISSSDFRNKALSNTDMGEASIINNTLNFSFGKQTSVRGTQDPYYLKRYESRTRRPAIKGTSSEDIRTYLYNKYSNNYLVECFLLTEQIVLSEELKLKMSHIPIYNILFDQCIEDTIFNHKEHTEKEQIKINFYNPVEQIILAINRYDNHTRNEWINFSNYEDSMLTEEKVLSFQDNLWYSASSNSNDITENVYVSNILTPVTIKIDKFQDFIFKYGPYGEATHQKAGTIDWGTNKLSPQYKPYTIKEIDTFRKIWKYRNASDIPVITQENYLNTWKESPLDTLEIIYHNEVREEVKSYSYYNKVQPYIYASKILDKGLFLYSYSLNVNKLQPHGSYRLNPQRNFLIKLSLNKTHTFNITPYAICHNILSIKNYSYELLFKSY